MLHRRPRANRRLVVLATFLVVTGSWVFRGSLAPAAPRAASAVVQIPKALPEAEAALPRVGASVRPAPGPPLRSDRDPFRFGGPEAALPARAPTPALPNLSLSSSIDEPSFVLLGVAEDLGSGGPRRTAIVGGADGQVWFVEEGDMLTELYRLEHVGAELAVLMDLRSSRKRQLVMR